MSVFKCHVRDFQANTNVMQGAFLITSVNTIADRLKWARVQRGLTQAQLASAARVSTSAIGNVESGIRERPRDLLAIANALRASPTWLESGKGAWDDAHVSTAVAVDSLTPAPASGQPAVYVPLFANAGSMGHGTDLEHDDVMIGTIALSPDWITKRIRPSSPGALRFIHAYGDSMSPTMEDGDVALVDTGRRDPSGADGVYVLANDKRVFIKRVTERMTGGHDVTSDNPTVKTVQELNGESAIRVLGKVVWVWNGRKL